MTHLTDISTMTQNDQPEPGTREHFLALLNDITRIALETSNYQTMLHILANRMAELFNADGSYITHWNQEQQAPELAAVYGPSTDPPIPLLLKSNKPSITHTVLNTQQVITIEDVATTQFADMKLLELTSDRAILALPLVAGDQKLGAVIITFQQPRKFTANEVEWGQQAARQIALAVAKAQLLETEREQRLLAETLQEVTLVFASKTNPAAVLDEILQQAQRLVPFKTSSITLLESNMLKVVRSRGYQDLGSANFISSLVQQLSELPLDSKVVETKEPLVIPDVREEPDWITLDETAWIRSVLMVPIAWAERVLGILRFDSQTPGTFSIKDAKRLQPLANAAAIALENARLHDQVQRHAAELEQRVAERTAQLQAYSQRQSALAEFELAINLPQELEAVLNRAADMTERLLPANGGAGIILWDGQTEEFNLGSASKLLRDRLPTTLLQIQNQKTNLQWIVAHHKPLTISDAKITHPNLAMLQAGIRGYIGVPLLAQGDVLGVLYATNTTPQTHSQDDLDFMVALANRISVAITKVRLYKQLAEAKDAAETASRAKSEFLANMSHELRTPLSAIIGFTEVLAERNFGSLNEKQDKYVKNILTSAHRLLELINDLLDLAKAEAGRMNVSLMPFDAAAEIHIMKDSIQMLAAEKEQRITVDIKDPLPVITADLPKFKKILHNLLTNAIKYTPKRGQITITVQEIDWENLCQKFKAESNLRIINDPAKPGESISAQYLWVSVTDTGIGLSQEDMNRIFTVFGQLDASYNRQQPGTGLGLALIQRLVNLQNGHIWVNSKGRGQGSVFSFALPLRASTNPQSAVIITPAQY